MENRGEGYYDYPSKIFCLIIPKNFLDEPFCVSKKMVSKNVKDERGGGGYHDLPSKLFCLAVPKHFVDEHFCVSENFLYRKILWIGERVSRVCVVTFQLKTVAEGWASNPYQRLQSPVVLPFVPREPLEFLTDVSEIVEVFGTTRTRTCRSKTLLS